MATRDKIERTDPVWLLLQSSLLILFLRLVADRILTCDLHADQIQGFFDIPVDHLDGSYIFIPYIKSLKLNELIFASPDVGGTKRTMEFAKYFETDMVICDKHRKRANEIASMQVIGGCKWERCGFGG